MSLEYVLMIMSTCLPCNPSLELNPSCDGPVILVHLFCLQDENWQSVFVTALVAFRDFMMLEEEELIYPILTVSNIWYIKTYFRIWKPHHLQNTITQVAELPQPVLPYNRCVGLSQFPKKYPLSIVWVLELVLDLHDSLGSFLWWT